MGLTYANITLSNPRDESLKPIVVKALVDTGALYLCLPEHVVNQLGLQIHETREVTLADGKTRTCPYVGPVEIHFDNRMSFVGAMMLGDEVLLGAIPMEDLDVVVHPSTQTLIVNPANPNMACGKVK